MTNYKQKSDNCVNAYQNQSPIFVLRKYTNVCVFKVILGNVMKLYVGNLPNSMTEEELTSEFKGFGEIQSLKIITDKTTGSSRGFGFIEMSANDAAKAIKDMNDTEIQGRKISVNEAKDRRDDSKRMF